MSATSDAILAIGPSVVALAAIGATTWQQRRGFQHQREMADLSDLRERCSIRRQSRCIRQATPCITLSYGCTGTGIRAQTRRQTARHSMPALRLARF
jgi:hypothetical protein